MQTLTTTQARKDLFNIAKRAAHDNEIINISTKYGDIVIVSRDFFDGIEETLYLDSIPGFYDSIKKSQQEIKEGKFITLEDLRAKYDL